MTGEPLGPFGTEAQAHAAAQAAADPGLLPIKASQNRGLLGRACEAAGVAMGRYDERILEWLSIWEPSTVVVIAGWVRRAFEAGQQAAAPGAAVLSQAESGITVIEVLRSAADALAADLAAWEARDPEEPGPEARRARRSVIATADAVTITLSHLRARLDDDRM
jgi:hypothetical protein